MPVREREIPTTRLGSTNASTTRRCGPDDARERPVRELPAPPRSAPAAGCIAGREGGDAAERLRQIQAREASDARRYREIYGVDYHDPQRYDLVLHTGGRSPAELAAEIVARARRAP